MHYDAFISYSHGADARLAPVLQRALHRFAKPWWTTRAVTVFRDETSLAAAHSLPETLARALAASRHFLLMASPSAAQSKWVSIECDWWAKNKNPRTMLVVLSGGEIAWDDTAGDFDWAKTTALPPVLKGVFKHEPLYLDLRWVKDASDFSDRDPRFLDSVARISAALRGMSLDAVAGEEVRQHRKTRRAAYAAVSAIAVLGAGASAGAWIATERGNEAERERQRVVRNVAAAIAAADSLLEEVQDGIFGLAWQQEAAWRRISGKAEAVFRRLDETGNFPQIKIRHGAMLRMIAEGYFSRTGIGRSPEWNEDEDLAQAVAHARRAIAILVDLERAQPGQAAVWRELALANAILARAAAKRDRREDVMAARLEAAAHAVRAARARPDVLRWVAEAVDAQYDLARLHDEAGARADAVAAYRTAFAVAEAALALRPTNIDELKRLHLTVGGIFAPRWLDPTDPVEVQFANMMLTLARRLAELAPQDERDDDIARQLAGLGDALSRHGSASEAAEAFQQAIAVQSARVKSQPSDVERRSVLAELHEKLAAVLSGARKTAEAIAALRHALRLREAIAAEQPGKPEHAVEVALVQARLGAALSHSGDVAASIAAWRNVVDISERLAAMGHDRSSNRLRAAGAYREIVLGLRSRGDFAGAATALHGRLAQLEALAREDGVPGVDIVDTLQALGEMPDTAGERDKALAAYRRAADLADGAVAAKPDTPSALHAAARARLGIATVLRNQNNRGAARDAYRDAEAALRRVAARDGDDDWIRRQLDHVARELDLLRRLESE